MMKDFDKVIEFVNSISVKEILCADLGKIDEKIKIHASQIPISVKDCIVDEDTRKTLYDVIVENQWQDKEEVLKFIRNNGLPIKIK